MTITLPGWSRRARIAGLIAMCAALLLSQRAAAVQSDSLEILQVRPSFFMIAGAGANIGVQVGEDGVVVVDPGAAAAAPGVLAAIKRISAKPIRYIIDTGPDGDHVGGNEALSKAGEKFFASSTLGGGSLDSVAPIVAVENILRRMTAFPTDAQPTDVFHYARQYMYLNGEAVEVLRQPAAHTDSDAIVFFRRSDVVVAGDVFDTRHFPVIDVDRGGTIQGEIAALNRIVELAVPSVPLVSHEGGTIVVPGHGRLCEQYDVVEYRDMVTIIRDRVRVLVKAGRSLAEVQAAQPAKGYMGRYGNPGGDWTTDRFVEAVYRSLLKEKS